MAESSIRDWNQGDDLSAEHWNEPLPTVRSVRTITPGSGDLEITQAETGTVVSVNTPGRVRLDFLGKIMDKGPNGEGDYPDERYWCQLEYLGGGSIADRLTFQDVVPQANPIDTDSGGSLSSQFAFDGIVTVTNLPEKGATNPHGLRTDSTQYVHVWTMFDVGSDASAPPQKHYVMSEAPEGDGLLWGTLHAAWSPPDNAVTLQPCEGFNDSTSLKKSDGTTPVDPVSNVYIAFPYNADVPCFQPQTGDILAYRYDAAAGIYYLVNPPLFPIPQNRYEVVLAISVTPIHWVNSYPLIHN